MPHKRAKRTVREQQRKERGADLAPSSGTSISTECIPKSAARVLDAARIRAEYRQKRARQLIDGADAEGDVGASKAPPLKKRRTNASAGGAGKGGGKPLEKGKDHPPAGTIEIRPGESLKHFNRRVEDHMRPLVQSAMRASAATERKERKAAASATSSSSNKSAIANKTREQPPKASSSSIQAHVEDASPPASVTARHDDDDRPKEFVTTSSAAPRRLNDVAMAPPELKKLPRGAAKQRSSAGGKAKAGVLSMAQRAMMEVERENAIRRYREMKERKAEEGDRTFILTE